MNNLDTDIREFATQTVTRLYKQADVAKRTPELILELQTELKPLVDLAVQLGEELSLQPATLIPPISVIPSRIVTFARQWYRRLHDDFQPQTDDRHYVENVRLIGRELTELLRGIVHAKITPDATYLSLVGNIKCPEYTTLS